VTPTDGDGGARAGWPVRLLGPVMHGLARLLPASASGENARAVKLFGRVEVARDLLAGGPLRRAGGRLAGRQPWPAVVGAYAVGDPKAPVAICTLTSNDLMQPLATLPGVAIAGRVYTPNLGIEKIIVNVTSNPAIRFLLLCGAESPVFHPAQALRALIAQGVTEERRIIGAEGHLPVLSNVPLARIERFRQQVELVDRTGETKVATIGAEAAALADRSPGPFPDARGDPPLGPTSPAAMGDEITPAQDFVPIRPGGKRQPLLYDPKGFFVVTLDRATGDIIVRHYQPDNTPAHEMRGRSAEPMLLGLLRAGLVSQLSHAGYLGAELAKAEAALRLGARYEQDQVLRPLTQNAARGQAETVGHDS